MAASNPPHSCIVILIFLSQLFRWKKLAPSDDGWTERDSWVKFKHLYSVSLYHVSFQVAPHCRLNSTACTTLGRWLIQSGRVRKRGGRIKTMSQSHHCHGAHHSLAFAIVRRCTGFSSVHRLLNYPGTKTAPPQVLKPPLHTLPQHQHQHQQ